MKIAICFSGQIRAGEKATPNILRFIGDLLPNCDFFMHTWDISSHKGWNPASKKTKELGLNRPTIESTYDIINNFLNSYPKKFCSVEIQSFQPWHREFVKKYHNFSPLWYSWYKSIRCKKEYEDLTGSEYDFVVKIRPDLIFSKSLSLQKEIDHVLKNKNNFYAMGYSPIRIDDVFFISSNEIMNRSCEFINEVKTFTWTTNIFGEYLMEKNIECQNTSQNGYTIYRYESLEISPLDFIQCFKTDWEHYSPFNPDFKLPKLEGEI